MSMLINLVGKMPRSWITQVASLQWKHPVLKRIVQFGASFFRNRDGVIQQGIGAGLRFNVGQANAGYLLGTSEPEVQAAIKDILRSGMVVYDIGANVGFFSIIAAHLVGPAGKVISFDPLPANANRLIHNAAINRYAHMSVRQEALSDCDRELAFLVSETQTLGRFSDLGPPAGASAEIRVSARRLDTIVSDEKLQLPHFIKMDVEGAEASVLVGAANVIRSSRPVMLIELHGTNIPVADFLEKIGYSVSVLGSSASVRDSPWNSHVLALPGVSRAP